MTSDLKTVLLFGRTGSGKSTLGNMMYARHPSPPGGFVTGNTLRGVTAEVAIKTGLGWVVTDTIGMGEAWGGTVSTEDAEDLLCEFLTQLRHTYSYLIYVVKQGRMEDAQDVTWKLFKELFKGGEKNFVVVFTSSNETWLEENMESIRDAFHGCKHFCAVDLPPVEQDEEMENILRDRRLRSIQALEAKLASFGLQQVRPRISDLTDAEVLRHVRNALSNVCKYVLKNFSFVRNPMQWIAMKVLGKLFE